MNEMKLIEIATGATREARSLAEVQKGLKWTGYVGAALLTEQGQVFTGINLDLLGGIGFCAEHSAIAEMVKHGETRISAIAAATARGNVLPPCGRCRELIYQINGANLDTEIIVGLDRTRPLKELLPEVWQESFDELLS